MKSVVRGASVAGRRVGIDFADAGRANPAPHRRIEIETRTDCGGTERSDEYVGDWLRRTACAALKTWRIWHGGSQAPDAVNPRGERVGYDWARIEPLLDAGLEYARSRTALREKVTAGLGVDLGAPRNLLASLPGI